MNYNWSPQQEAAISQVVDWLNDIGPEPEASHQVCKLFGYAGTGKTTLAMHLAGDMNWVRFAAFTGKAAHVMAQKGCRGAQTIHSLIYRKVETHDDKNKNKQPTRKLEFELNPESILATAETQLIVIDECSMVGEKMGKDLLSFEKPVLVLGDPAQLPPIKGAGFFTSGKPNIMLTEIHRQAEGNPIIQLATLLRREGRPSCGHYGDSRVISDNNLTETDLLEADQVLVGRNATRHRLNQTIRRARGYTHNGVLPCKGERLVCLRNNWPKGAVNGSIWYAAADAEREENWVSLPITSEDSPFTTINVKVHASHFDSATKPPEGYFNHPDEYTFGHALTVHKAQGSQWKNVVIIDESWVFRENAFKWAYTAVTRAAEKLTLVT